MCKYWSGIVTKDGKVLFTEDDSHETVIKRSGLNDCSLENREFVRIEVENGNMKNYRVDESDTLPSWYEKRENEFHRKVELLLKKLVVAKPKRDAINAEYQPKRDAINAEWQPKRDALNAEYQTKRDALKAEYQTKRDAINAEYQTKRDAIYAEYQPKRDAIYKGIKGYLGGKSV